MNDQAIRFRVGIFFLGAMLLLAFLIILFGGFPNYFKAADAYTVVFDNAPNVATGTPVRRSGVKIGDVRKIELDNQTGKVNVTISIDPAYTIRKSDQATLVSAFLGGDTTIDFLPPRDAKAVDNRAVEPGSVLVGVVPTDTAAFVQKTGELLPPARETMDEMKKVAQTFNKMAPLMEETFREFKELGKATREVIPELRKTNDEVRGLAKATRDVIPELRKTNDEIRELARASHQSIPDLKKTNNEFQLAARNWAKVGERVDVLLQTNEEKLVKALERFDDTLKKISATFSEENQRHLSDILRNVKVSSDKLDSIVRNTDEMMKESRTTLKRVNDSLGRSDEILANMQRATKPLAERSESILRNIEESTDRLNKVLGDARELMHAVARSEGTVHKLLTDATLYKTLNDAAGHFSRLAPRLEHILRDVEIFADKIARHPETLGIGGVVRPGTGLKEPPTVLPWRPHY